MKKAMCNLNIYSLLFSESEFRLLNLFILHIFKHKTSFSALLGQEASSFLIVTGFQATEVVTKRNKLFLSSNLLTIILLVVYPSIFFSCFSMQGCGELVPVSVIVERRGMSWTGRHSIMGPQMRQTTFV